MGVDGELVAAAALAVDDNLVDAAASRAQHLLAAALAVDEELVADAAAALMAQ